MASILSKLRSNGGGAKRSTHTVVPTSYSSHPVDIPENFLPPIPDPSTICVSRVDFGDTDLPEYEGMYAVVLDGVLSRDECNQLLHYTEQSAGAHQENGGKMVEGNGWKTAMVNAGVGHEFLALDYRNSDRIIWDQPVLVKRLWERILQGDGMREDLCSLSKEKNPSALGKYRANLDHTWVSTEQGLNERMRFLRYGPGQFFREHCDGTYGTPDGDRSFLTLHLYLNDSVQALKKEKSTKEDGRHFDDVILLSDEFLYFNMLIYCTLGAEVTKGLKYTMRTDVMYRFEDTVKEDDDGIVFEDG